MTITRFLSSALVVAVLCALVPSRTRADSLTYTPTPVGVGQTSNNPCVIGDPSCDTNLPAGNRLTYTSNSGPCNGGAGGVCDFFSPVYVAGSTLAAPLTIPLTFSIGVDENVALGHAPETLTSFQLLLCSGTGAGSCNTVLDSTTGPNTLVPENNGNGFTDGILSGFSTLTAGNHYEFHATWSNDTDGMEQFWIIPGGAPSVPEPASLMLLGVGLLSLGGVTRRRYANK